MKESVCSVCLFAFLRSLPHHRSPNQTWPVEKTIARFLTLILPNKTPALQVNESKEIMRKRRREILKEVPLMSRNTHTNENGRFDKISSNRANVCRFDDFGEI